MWRFGTGCPTGRGGGPSLPCNLTQTCWPTGRRTATARRRRGDGAATARRRRGDPTAMDCITIRARSTMVQTDVPSLRPRQRSTRRESREAQTRNMDPCVRAPSVVLCETYFAPTLRSVPPSSPRGRPLHRASGSIWTDYVACACSSAGVLPRVPPPVALLAHTMWLPRSIDPCSRARCSSLSLRCSALRPPPPKLPPRRQPVPPFF